MQQLPKAVYLLFLRYPDGLRFKELTQYRNELTCLYMDITSRNDISSVYKIIEDITDPTKNFINEKCSPIKEAFIFRFDDRLALNYYVTGLAGFKKGIILKTELVNL